MVFSLICPKHCKTERIQAVQRAYTEKMMIRTPRTYSGLAIHNQFAKWNVANAKRFTTSRSVEEQVFVL